MSQVPFSTEWLNRFQDPYAVLGLSVTADDRRVLKRYREIAKLLHPDGYVGADAEVRNLATQLFAKIVGPAYQKLKQDKGRAENLAMLRFRVRRSMRETPLEPKSALALELMGTQPSNIDVFYEQAIARLAETQFIPLERFDSATLQLEELNLVYLRLKMGEPIIREKRTGLVSSPPVQAHPKVAFVEKKEAEAEAIDYAERHFNRAQSYAQNANWASATRELKDALKINANRSNYHALLAIAYLKQDLPTMARVHCRQALKLNPKDTLALKYASKLGVDVEASSTGKGTSAAKSSDKSAKASPGGGLFSFLGKRH
ncbi:MULTISPECIES: J domain-containing protein [unclassified Leptolyngbya]|uniref:J domain-containing protein n=1 Tax=unclassified Leptolyngbya TaxID=2650499 RepID=UPI0016851743|nr:MULTISPECIES: J domain-containing protein [unclassified Leptolyngbya]MBD1910366.1 J domain-containing protein [Leptolyngbya sp. FACHB-8]MBD2155294.1 J domain-containing protein [Leptolyngbya sp. FACHB-16]